VKNLRAALITGASSGIGEAFANALAAQGLDLILVARSEHKLKTLARQLAEVYARRVEVVTADLGLAGAADKVHKAAAALDMDVGLLVNNAGFGTVGTFHKLDAVRERDEILLNAAAVVDMTRAFLPAMVEARRGGIINVASMAAFQPLPYMSVYAATKAFVLAFSEGVRGEVRGRGVNVLCVCPGPVDTPFFEATGSAKLRSSVPRATMMTAEDVVTASLKAFKAGRGVVVPGLGNKLVSIGTRFVPREIQTALTARFMQR
jgi:hypothetical protein